MSSRQSEEARNKERFEKEALVHIESLFRTALRMTKNEGDADDLVQETFLKAWRFWDKFQEGSNCRAWLFKIMTNIFINNYRAKAWTPQTIDLEDVDDDFLFGQLSALGPSDDPEKHFFNKVFDDDVKKAIEELPEDFRLVVVLSFLEGFSYQEIADIVNLNIGTVKSRLHRGRKLLQKSLWEYAVKNGFVKEAAK
ncbi:MAG: RNA polymerase subunit sigma-24 [candidate division Zixibacteria bacterium HGW-Zixibacteria-1]|nr:MAG: RNA polymerase subunit sigma-24 [candidate division Zixibacteria bacterium HGW-Zixibacteria-1]